MTTSTWALCESWSVSVPPWLPSCTPVPSSAIRVDCPGPIVVLIVVTFAVLVHEPPVCERLRDRREAREHHDLAAHVRTGWIDQRALNIDRGRGDGRRRWWWRKPPAMSWLSGVAPGAALPAASVGIRCVWKPRKRPRYRSGNFRIPSAVVKHAVVGGVLPDVALVHVDVVNPGGDHPCCPTRHRLVCGGSD